jgi:hypothetical protein
MRADLLIRLSTEYPASRHSTAWVLDECGVPTRRVGWNVGDEETLFNPVKRGVYRHPEASVDHQHGARLAWHLLLGG